MRCKDCKHWQDGIADAPKEEYGYCNSDKFEDISNHGIMRTYENDMLLSEDHESYASIVYVGKNFGCIHFEKKELKGNE